MPDLPPRQPRQLNAAPIAISSREFREIQSWQFESDLFYIRQVQRMLRLDVSQLFLQGDCTVFQYIDPLANGEIVGVGVLQKSDVHSAFTGGLSHPYISVLSVKPGIPSHGYGQAIVEHLVAEAANMVGRLGPGISDLLFLDVYAANGPAYRLYERKCNFVNLNPDTPILDPEENNQPYFVMGRRVSVESHGSERGK